MDSARRPAFLIGEPHPLAGVACSWAFLMLDSASVASAYDTLLGEGSDDGDDGGALAAATAPLSATEG